MKDENVINLIESAGNHHRYQYSLFILVFLIYGASEFITISIPYIEIRPSIIEKNKTQELTYSICNEYKNENKKIDIIITKTTIVSDLKIYCDKEKTTFLGTSIFIGILIGSLFNSYLADNLGRKKTMIIAGGIFIFSIFSVSFIRNYYLIIIILTLTGFAYILLALSSFIMMNETVKKELVSIFSSFIYSAYDLFGIIYPLLFYFLNKWWYLYVIVGVFFSLIYITFIVYAVESPLFLFSKGKIQEFKISLESIRNKNRLKKDEVSIININDNSFLQDEVIKNDNSKVYSVFDLVRLKSQRWNFISISLIWFVCAFIYYGITINIKNLNGNIYFRGIEMNLVEIFIVIGSGFISNIKFFGRTRTIKIFLLISFVSFVILVFLEENSNFYFILMISGRVSLSSVFSVIYYVSNEIYPTPLRAKGLSMNSLFSRFGGILAPFVIEYMKFQDILILYCFLVIISFFFSFVVEETLNNSMRSFVPEMEENRD